MKTAVDFLLRRKTVTNQEKSGMKLFGIALSSMALVACGGGGGESAPINAPQVGPPIAVSTSNYVAASKEVIGGASTLQNTSGITTDLFVGAEVTSTLTVTGLIKDKLPAVLKQFSNQSSQFTGVTQSDVLPCTTSGKLDLSFTDVNGNELPDRGDSVTINATNCNENGSVIDGSMILRFESVSGDIDLLPFSTALSVAVRQLRIETAGEAVVSNGSLEISLNIPSSDRLSINVRAPNFVSASTFNGISKVYQHINFAVNLDQIGESTTMTLNGGINVPSLGGNTVNVQTIRPVTLTNAGTPSDGELLLTTNLGGKMRLLANGTSNATVQLDATADGTFESSSTFAWNELL